METSWNAFAIHSLCIININVKKFSLQENVGFHLCLFLYSIPVIVGPLFWISVSCLTRLKSHPKCLFFFSLHACSSCISVRAFSLDVFCFGIFNEHTRYLSYAGKVIDGGKVVIEVSFLRVPVHTEKHDLSEEISCPIAVGNFVLSHTQTLPVFTPHVSLFPFASL